MFYRDDVCGHEQCVFNTTMAVARLPLMVEMVWGLSCLFHAFGQTVPGCHLKQTIIEIAAYPYQQIL